MRFLTTLLFLTFSTIASANQYSGAMNAAIVGAAVGGIATGTQFTVYRSLMAAELEGWSNKETGSTITLESQCNVQAEMHLVGDHQQIYVLIGLSNTTEKTFVVQPKDIEFIFNKEHTRFPGWQGQQSDMILKPSWWQLNYVPFPSKEEFANYENLEVRIPIMSPNEGTCVLKANFKKYKKIQKEEMSYTAMDLNFEGGPSLSQNGPVKFLGKPESMFGISMNLFPHPNHGFGLMLLTERPFEDSKNTKIHRKFEKGAKYSASSMIFGFNYAYRHFLSNRLTANYEPTLGFQTIYDEDDRNNNDGREEKSNSLAIVQKLMLNWTFARVTGPTYRSLDFTAGIGLVHTWVPSAKIGGQNINGDRYGALLRFGMGF